MKQVSLHGCLSRNRTTGGNEQSDCYSFWKYFLQEFWVVEFLESGFGKFGQFLKQLFVRRFEIETRFPLHALFNSGEIVWCSSEDAYTASSEN